jgi:hypothetical protein
VAMLKSMGVASIKKLNKKNVPKIEEWVLSNTVVEVDYPDQSSQIVEMIVQNHAGHSQKNTNLSKLNSNIYKHI